MADRVIRLRPYNYIHVLNNNTNVTTVELGPKTFVRRDHEQVVAGPSNMINIPPRSYCVVANPAFRNEDNSAVSLENGQVKLKHGETEIRLYNDWPTPFPLYPGEILVVGVTLLTVVAPNSALRIQATRNFEESDGQGQGITRAAGDEWLFVGPATYIPRVEAKVVETVFAQIIRPNEALRLRAKRAFTDRNGVARSAGEEWLHREPGSVLCDVEEEVVGLVKARVLTERKALHLLAEHTFTDVYGVLRKAGQEWLVTHKLNQLHIPDIYENVRGEVDIRVLGQNQYAVVLNPVGEDGNPRWGTRELRLGEQSFFLQPGEKLQAGIQNIEILSESEALLLRANEKFVETVDGKREERYPGQEWMIYGPRRYVPPVEVEIVESRKRIPLDLNEGIYVRDKKTGKVYTVTGQTYMLKPNEELWSKELPAVVEQLLVNQVYSGADSVKEKPKPRIAHKVVTYRVPHNAAVQLYDYKKKKSRVVFGPELVMLEPDEEFTIVSLSGGEPKRPNAITSLSLSLGPDFMSDSVIVETSDHARLRLKLSYNWAFEVEREDEEQAHVIFSVRDFVGDTCKAIASRVRGAVAAETFDNFHKNSADIIRRAVFGVDDDGVSGEKLLFSSNLLAITNVDIQSVEPVEQRTRDALQKSVQLAIEIATASQEALSNHEAAREEQIAEGKLQRQKIADQSAAERDRKVLVELKAQTASARAKGQAKAEAEAEAEAALIQARTAVSQAEKKAQALKIRSQARLSQLKSKQQQELTHKKACDALEIKKAEEQAQIEAEKFAKIVNAIGADTIQAIAQAGPEMQAKLLEGLGLQGFLVTDGTSPINLFNTANGLVGN